VRREVPPHLPPAITSRKASLLEGTVGSTGKRTPARGAAGARWITFCLAASPGVTDSRSLCAVRSREYQEGRCAPALVVTCK